MKDYEIKKDRTPIDEIALKTQILQEMPESTMPKIEMCELTVIYHEDFEDEVIGMLSRTMTITRYTKIRDVVGARADAISSDDEILKIGKNNMLIIIAERSEITEIVESLRTLREIKGHGIRGYVIPVETVI